MFANPEEKSPKKCEFFRAFISVKPKRSSLFVDQENKRMSKNDNAQIKKLPFKT